MNIEAAQKVLEDLEQQLRNADQQAILLSGAVQGAKSILKALEEIDEEKVAPKNLPKNKTSTKGN